MATITYSGTSATGSAGNDTIRLANFKTNPSSGSNIYTVNGLAGSDTFDLITGQSYSTFISTNFTIGAADATGMIVVSGASGNGAHFTFNLTGVESLKFSDTTFSLSAPTPPADTTPPTISAFSPATGATGIATGSDIVITFSEAVQLGSGLIEVHSGSATGPVVATNTTEALSVSGSTLTINPTVDLANGTHYFVTLAAGSIKDLAGNNYAGTTTYDFTTVATADTTPPTVSAFSPAVGATGISNGSDIVITFSEAVQLGSGLIEVHSGSATGPVVATNTTETLSVSGTTLTINPTANLANGTHYFVTLAAGSIKDLAGNNYAGTTTYDFTTVAAADTTPPTVTAISPAVGATGISTGSDIVITFSEAVQLGSGLIEVHSGSATGPVVATNTTEALSVSGTTLTINPTANLANGTHYFVTLAAGSIKDLAGNNYAGTTTYDFTTVAADTTPPTVVTYSPAVGATGISTGSDIVISFSEAVQLGTGLIQVHSGSATGAVVATNTTEVLSVSGSSLTINPTANLANGTHYFVTLAAGSITDLAGNNYTGTTSYDFFTAAAPSGPTDNTPPTVVTYSPSVAATGVGISSNILLTFSEAVQRGAGLIELHSGSATGPVVASYEASTSTSLSVLGKTLTINPIADLGNGTHYFVTLASGSIQDTAGNSYAGTSAYDFTTVAAVDTTSPTVVNFSPSVAATGVGISSDIVLTFSEAVQRGAGLIELHGGSATGTVVASYDASTSTNLSVSGNTLTINPTADLANGTHYFVTFASGSIHDTAGNSYAGTSAYDFFTAAAPSGPTDNTSPTVVTYSPSVAATDVTISSDIVLTFSEAVQLGTGLIEVHSGSATGAVVATNTTESLTFSGTTLTINPIADLSNGIDYYVTLAQGSVHDLAGNSYSGTTAYHFSTVSAAVTPPVVPTTALPADGSSYTAPALAGVGILGILSWVLL